MKSLLSIASVAVILAASAAHADSQQLFIEQIGNGHHAEFGQTGLYNSALVLQNGNGEQAFAYQYGQNNSLNARQGMVNAANNGSAPHAYEASSGSEFLSSTQLGDSNIAVVAEVGVSNQLSIYQNGNSNNINSAINDNLSTTSVTQTGYLNSVVTHQGI